MLENIMVKAKTADEAFIQWYKLLSSQNDCSKSRDGDVVGEAINAITVIEDPTRCIMTNDLRKMSLRYAFGEMLWYASANENIHNTIDKFTKVWEGLSDDGVTVNSNYGYCIKKKFGFDQYEYVKQILKNDKNSRQAVIHIKDARNTIENPTKDLNCTVCLQFLIRDEKLYLTSYMRSNDLWLGFPYDVFNFTALQILLSMELEVGLGAYTHIDGSLHLYKRDFDKVNEREGKNV